MLNNEAVIALETSKHEFTEMLETLKGDIIFQSGFTIVVYDRVYDLIYNNKINCDYLSELVLCNEGSLVGKLAADYVLKGHTDLTEIENFVTSKVNELKPQ